MDTPDRRMIAPIEWFVGLAITDPDYAEWLAAQEAVDVSVGGNAWVAVYEARPEADDGR